VGAYFFRVAIGFAVMPDGQFITCETNIEEIGVPVRARFGAALSHRNIWPFC
jgi:hypothetical protein